ncbi:MAG: cation-translocating P-type ATPase [Tatlockia sp.]|nr:cation-translocating P-type ATPase [Tatlockia sp.]
MAKQIIFQDSFLLSGIMCFSGCGTMIRFLLEESFEDFKKKQRLPEDAHLIIDPQPHGLGIHRLKLIIESENEAFQLSENCFAEMSTEFKQCLTIPDEYTGAASTFQLVDLEEEKQKEASNRTHWINIIINVIAMVLIIALSIVFPPSIPLTIILTAISFITTAFTAREYLISFYRNLRNKNFANMTTTVTLGWFLSLAHTLFHVIAMPLASSFTMVFMSFLMPVMLITFINGMDEIKRLILDKSRKMNLQGIKSLFPEMSKHYACYELSKEQSANLSQWIAGLNDLESKALIEECPDKIREIKKSIMALLSETDLVDEKKNSLQEGSVIQIKRGECFPVDCILIEEHTIVDSSLITGEPRQAKKYLDKIPAGAINFGQNVKVYATKNTYNSTVTRLLFPANRAANKPAKEAKSKFTYIYAALIVIGIITAIVFPLALGVFTVPLLFQNLMGIIFSVCFCTIAIALQLPGLISIYHRSKKGIQLRDEEITERNDEIHTVVFDKTGTLTTGDSSVESTDIISDSLWERIYLLEKEQGAEHPIAKALMKYYGSRKPSNIIINEVENSLIDPDNRGLTALVQGKQIHLGNAAFLKDSGIKLPILNNSKIEQGFSPVYVAESNVYQGVIYIKHAVRPGIIAALTRLKTEGKKIIMLTGDSRTAALGFNKQIDGIFDAEAIHAEQTPENKETFLKELMGTAPEGLRFVGDGLNDAPCSRIVSEKGGISCAMNSDDKAAFFTDICLNGSVDYLFSHNKINHFLQKIVLQNKGILAFSTTAFIAFIISFSIAGIAVSPFIPLTIMLSTTLFVLFNSYRTQLEVDIEMDKSASWPKKLLASDLSIALLIAASSLLVCGILISTIATGGLALPALVFTAGTVAAISSICTIGAMTLFSLFTILVASYFVAENYSSTPLEEKSDLELKREFKGRQPLDSDVTESETYSSGLNFSKNLKTSSQCNLIEEELILNSAQLIKV